MSGINKYNDISEMIKSDIFNGKLKENMALPSIRKLAQRYKVNPATVVRALHILRNQKIVYSNRTNGFYVCEDISQVRQNLAEQVIADFLHNMSSIPCASHHAASVNPLCLHSVTSSIQSSKERLGARLSLIMKPPNVVNFYFLSKKWSKNLSSIIMS